MQRRRSPDRDSVDALAKQTGAMITTSGLLGGGSARGVRDERWTDLVNFESVDEHVGAVEMLREDRISWPTALCVVTIHELEEAGRDRTAEVEVRLGGGHFDPTVAGDSPCRHEIQLADRGPLLRVVSATPRDPLDRCAEVRSMGLIPEGEVNAFPCQRFACTFERERSARLLLPSDFEGGLPFKRGGGVMNQRGCLARWGSFKIKDVDGRAVLNGKRDAVTFSFGEDKFP